MSKKMLVAVVSVLTLAVLLPNVYALIWPTTGKVIGIWGDPRRTHMHKGTDIYNRRGTGIGSSEYGTVAYAAYGYNGAYGNVVYVSHPRSLQTRYAHLNSIRCRRGQRVARNFTIGTMGNSATGNVHLHFEVLKYGSKIRVPVRRYTWVVRGRHIYW